MFDDLDQMARIEREIGRSACAEGIRLPERSEPEGPQGAGRMEDACEKDSWVVSVAMMPPESTTLFIEKFGEAPLRSSDEDAALKNAQTFAKAEFGAEAEVIREEMKIPSTRAPYHVRLRLKVDASKRVQELAA